MTLLTGATGRRPPTAQRRAFPAAPIAAAVSFAVAGAPGCGSRPGAAGAADTVYIAVAAAVGPRTEPYFNGVRLAVEHLNAAEGARLAFAVRTPPETASSQVAVAAAFREDARVIGVVGHTGSAQTLEAAPIYADLEHGGRHAVVAITPTATNPRLTEASPWVFRVCPTDDDGARALARFAADSLGVRRAAVLYRNDLFGRGFTRTFRAALAERGGRVVERDPYLAGITEYVAYALRIARERPDAVVVAGGAEDAAEIVRALRDAGADVPVLGSDDLAALDADPALSAEFRGLRYTSFFLADRAATPAAIRFVQDYRARFGAVPDHRAALSYDAAMLIGLAAREVGPDRRRIRDRIAEVGRGRPAYAGATGEIRFDETGDPVNKPVHIAEVAP